MAASTPMTQSGTGRGPAPPLPEKPPSVAERTRLLKSSFRKDDVDKPKVVSSSPIVERAATLPHSHETNGDKSETPSPASSVGSMTGVGVKASTLDSVKDLPPKPAVSPPAVLQKSFNYIQTNDPSHLLELQMTKERQQYELTMELNAKREAFFKDAPKFDPAARFAADRERREERTREPVASKDDDREKEHHKERKHGGGDAGSKELEGYVGFANLPNQVYRKSVKKGFEFTLMVVGESGLGKSTLINSLFLSDLYSSDYPGPSHRIQKTVKVDTTQVVLKENGVQLKLTTVDTPGFGDAVDNSNCWQPVIDYIDSKYDEYLNAESRVNRITNADTRVHVCCYFIAPTGHGLKPLDVEFMKRLHDKVNIIPIIAKADTLTPDECREFKKTILNEIAQHKIKIYEFPECDDEEENKLQKKMRDRVPFAVIGSNRVIESGGKKVRGRQYPWGIVEVENLEHNDFIALRNMLIRKHMQDLKDVTNNVHYENFRYNKLAPTSVDGNKIKPGSLSKDPLTQMAEEKRDHDIKMKKMEAEMEHVFETKVKEKEQKLKESEADLQRRSEHTKKSLDQQQKEMDDKWAQFQKEKKAWEEAMGISGSNENIKESHDSNMSSTTGKRVVNSSHKKEKKGYFSK